MTKTQKKRVIAEAIKEVKNINPYWISFFHGAIQEHKIEGTPMRKIVKREFKGLNKERPGLTFEDENKTAKFIAYYAETHFNMNVKL